jgi:lysozyme
MLNISVPIFTSGAASGKLKEAKAVAEGARTVADVKHATEDLGAWLAPVLMLAVVALCGYIMWERIKQRKGGWS